jgi:nitrogen regulatory protein P-II 1
MVACWPFAAFPVWFPSRIQRIDMKQIITVVKPFLAEQVLKALEHAPLEALNVHEVKGYGRQKNYLDQYTETEYALAYLPKVEIQVWVEDARVEETLRKIISAARTGRIGDGKIMVLPVVRFENVIDLAQAELRAVTGNT